jgi:transposase
MAVGVLLRENEALRDELAERDRLLAERDRLLAERDRCVADLEEQLATLAKKLELTVRERALLATKLAQLQSLRSRVPVLAPGQGVLEFGDPVAEPDAEPTPAHVDEAPDGETERDRIKKKDKPKNAARKLDLSNLPVEHVHHELEAEKRICPVTGKLLVPVGEKLEEEVEYQPGSIKRIVHHHVVYGLSDEDRGERQAPERIAPGPARPLEGSVAGPMLLALLLAHKFVYHLPLYRQESMFERMGLRLPRQTMCDWVLGAAAALGPIQQALRRMILATGVVQIDDTPVKCQGPKGQGVFQARLWTVTSPLVEGVAYEFTESRSHEAILEVLGDFEHGVLVGDGYPAYETVARKRPGIKLAGCWAHALRYFKDAMKDAPLDAVRVMTAIAKLFEVEEETKDLAPEERLEVRKKEAPFYLEAVDGIIEGWRDRYSEAGKMGEACKYRENQAEALKVFLEDGRVPIHNNACERSIRPIAVGRKNWLFAGSVRGGKAAATIYTLVECCKLTGVDPAAYLADVLVRVATHPASRVEELLPANWKRLFGQADSSASA